MREQSFYKWLLTELQTARIALLGLYERRDELLYEQAPALRKRYMETIGNEEESVLQAELETALLRRKLEMIQIAVNRREPIDLEKIETALADEREALIASVESGDRTLEELPELTEEQQNELRQLYREITEAFHPALHNDLTQTQRELYEKAVYAYKMLDLQGMQIVHDLLFPDKGLELGFSFDFSLEDCSAEKSPEQIRLEYADVAKELSVDYRLAEQVYSAFVPLEEDAVVSAFLHDCMEKQHAVQQEVEMIRAAFPFNALATLDNPQRTSEYLAQLQVRAMNCRMEKAQLEKKIQQLTEAIPHG